MSDLTTATALTGSRTAIDDAAAAAVAAAAAAAAAASSNPEEAEQLLLGGNRNGPSYDCQSDSDDNELKAEQQAGSEQRRHQQHYQHQHRKQPQSQSHTHVHSHKSGEHVSGSATLRSTTSARSNQTASTTITANVHDIDVDVDSDNDVDSPSCASSLAMNREDVEGLAGSLPHKRAAGLDDSALRYCFKGRAPELYSPKEEFIYSQTLVKKQLVLKKTCEWWFYKNKCNTMSTPWRHLACFILIALAVSLIGIVLFWLVNGSAVPTKMNSKLQELPSATRNHNHKNNNNNNNINNNRQFIDSPTQFINDTIVVNWSEEENDDIGVLEDIGDDNLCALVTPVKVYNFSLNSDDLLYESKRNSSSNSSEKDSAFSQTGTFRSKSSQIWDPHPQYKFNAFGKQLHLILHKDTSFIPTNQFRVIRILNNKNDTEDTSTEQHFLGCYYKGYVEGDKHSAVAVSLCNGMTGYIKTGFGTLLIQPVSQSSSNCSNSTNTSTNINNANGTGNGIASGSGTGSGSGSGNGVDDGGSEILHKVWRHSLRNARHAVSDFELDMEALELAASLESPKLTRRKRHNLDNQVYTLEMLVAVDATMVEFHKNDLSSYILILLSIVSNIFADASIGNSIHISLVNLLVLRDNITDKVSEHGHRNHHRRPNSASEMLKHFCSFLSKKNYHYDTAMLITRDQICGNGETKCHTLGLAELGTVCKPHSCSIVQDNGLPAAFTIAHELGHILNMPHDDDDRCRPHNNKPGGKRPLHIMSSVMGDNMHPWSWSKCSQHYVSEFLEKADKSCLEDTPASYIRNMNTKQPGEIYSLDHQCQLIHGNQSLYCHLEDECRRLWCKTNEHVNDACRSSNLPWADGTPCNNNRHWCQKGKCLPREGGSLQVVHGGWGPWSAFTPCSLTCGGGVQESRRECNSPLPENGGKYCVGSRKKYRSCATHNCPPGTVDSREQQCYDMNGRNLGIKGISPSAKWIPKYGLSPQDKCRLYCRLEDNSAYFQLDEKVKDGTTCSFDSFDKCVNGICRPAGCDNELNSIAKLDKCGVCEGRNDTCEEYTGNFYVSDLFKQKKPASCFYYVTTIPKGASNIIITQPGYPKHNYIALSDDKRHPLLNSNKVVSSYPRKDHYAGVTFEYNGSNSTVERVNTTYSRKLKRDLIVEVISIDLSAAKNNDTILISYTYTIDKQNYMEPEVEIYRWEMQTWSNCDSLCQGRAHRLPACVSTTQGLKVAPQFCDETAKPKVEYRYCNTDCELSLTVSNISECSASCGQLGTREKTYNCIQTFPGIHRSNIVDMSYCELKFEIVRHEQCREGCWNYTEWSTCTKTCGTGTQVREVRCFLNQTPVSDELCNPHTKHLDELLRTCNMEPCNHNDNTKNQRSVTYWMAGEWGVCNDWCKKNRTVTCTQPYGYGCPPDRKPKEVRSCCQIKYISDWKECSVECGTGIRRKVQHCTRVYKPEEPGKPRRRVYVNESYCLANKARRPTLRKTQKACKINCKWNVSDWTRCAANCADDYQSRHVQCESWQGKQVNEHFCDAKKKPPRRKICNNCIRREPKKISACDCDGYQRVRVFCYDSTGRRITCPTKEKTIKQKCTPPRDCQPQSCADLQRMSRIYADGDYKLFVRSRSLTIYCHNMNSRTPREYITLNPLENYSIFYEYKTRYPDKCPPESRDHEFYNNQNTGRTSFHKLRLNITNLRVIENDFEFATTIGAQRQAYGSAGDCYNRNMDCPQADFSINLKHTGFVIRPGVAWDHFGNRMVMKRSGGFDSSQTRRAFCGGYCGSCAISSAGLFLDVL